MVICGIVKLSLLDYPDKMAATIFTGGCNLRCPFCHNGSLVTDVENSPRIPEDDILSYLEKRKGILDGVCITGGEPLLNRDIDDFIRKIKDKGYLVKLDTNGTFPKKLQELIDSGNIDYVAMDIKNCKEKYPETVGIRNFDIRPVEESVDILMKGKVPYEFRTTLVREFHSLADMDRIGAWLKGAPSYYLQAFKDSGNLIKPGLSGFGSEEMEAFAARAKTYFDKVELRGL